MPAMEIAKTASKVDTVKVVVMLMLLLVVSSCAVVYISEGNTQDRTNSILREKHIEVTDDTVGKGDSKDSK